MKEELELKLKEQFPILFKYYKTKDEYDVIYPIYYGIECDDGWFNLIQDTLTEMVKLDPDVELRQIKEKFGLLRIHHSSLKDSITRMNLVEITLKSQYKSANICEICGKEKDNKISTINGWILKSVCKECFELIESGVLEQEKCCDNQTCMCKK